MFDEQFLKYIHIEMLKKASVFLQRGKTAMQMSDIVCLKANTTGYRVCF